jgi:signal recognition particle receptor subunit beta
VSARAGMVRRQRAATTTGNKPVKIVVTGPFSAGKTTLIRTVSEVAIVGTERDVTDDTRAVKDRTTVAMDFGRISFESASLFLFGTPGQRRFEVMWEILSDGMVGFILLVHATDERSLMEAWHILDTFRRYADVPYVIGLSHVDEVAEEEREHLIAKVREVLELPENVTVSPCDPREKEDVKGLMLTVLNEVKDRLERAEGSE